MMATFSRSLLGTLTSIALLFSGLLNPSAAKADYITEGITSPFTTDAKYFLYTGSALTFTVWALKHNVTRSIDNKTYIKKPLGSYSVLGYHMGHLYPNIFYLLFQTGLAFAGNKKGVQRAAEMFFSTVYAGGVSTALKYTVRESRPHNPHSRISFPSGHASAAFAFGAYVAAEHEWYWGIPSILLATFVGFSRINDGAHHLHDVLAGATIGISYGVGMQRLGRGNSPRTTYFLPVVESGTYAFNLLHTF